MLKTLTFVIALFITQLLLGQIKILKINDSNYNEIKIINKKMFKITNYENNERKYQTNINDTSQLKSLNLYPLNECYYESVPFIKEQIVFYYKNGKISKEINFKRKRIHFYSQIEVRKYDTSGQLKHYSFNSNKRIGKNYSLYSDYIKGNLIYEEKSSYYNFKYKKTYLKKAYMIDSLKNKYTLVKNCWSDYPSYQINNSNTYFIQDKSWIVKLTKTDVKNEYILTHYIDNNKKQLSQKFIQINKKKQTFRNDDQLWSYIKNSTDTFFNDSGGVDYIQRYSKKGNLIFQKKDNNDLVCIKKTSDSLIISHINSKDIVLKKHKHYIIKYFSNDSLMYETKYYKKYTEHKIYKNGANVSTEIFDAYKQIYITLNNYFKDIKIVELEDFFLL